VKHLHVRLNAIEGECVTGGGEEQAVKGGKTRFHFIVVSLLVPGPQLCGGGGPKDQTGPAYRAGSAPYMAKCSITSHDSPACEARKQVRPHQYTFSDEQGGAGSPSLPTRIRKQFGRKQKLVERYPDPEQSNPETDTQN